MHLGTRVRIAATSAVLLLACGDAGELVDDGVSSTSSAAVPVIVDYDGTFTVSWNVNPGPNQGGYAYLSQRYNGGAWTSIYYTGLGAQSRTVTVTQHGVYDYRVTYAYMPANPCGYRYCVPGLVHGTQTLPSVHYAQSGAICGNGVPDPGEACDDGNGTSGDGCEPDCTLSGGGPCGSDAECAPGQSCVGGICT